MTSSVPTTFPLSSSPLYTAPTTPDHFTITPHPLSLDEVYQRVDDGANGAIVIMSGMVRNQTDGQSVIALEYQAYEPMAVRVFEAIATAMRHQWPDITHVVIHHRIGQLTVGDISVLVAVGCPHRAEAFAACQYAIDTLKHNAPIWKKEHWQDGSTSWVSIGACEQKPALESM
ncbi:MAG: molybdenum cofactor biosynthesis protein MoaE [Leptolyngbyaceae bacterium]|nr:molybdenum cofactor biosynthesis protein MoaE [Leptolyngbyaceae bacterium]